MSVELSKSAIKDKIYETFNKRKFSDIIRGLTPDSTFTLNIMEDNMYDYYYLTPDDFKDVIREVIIMIKEEQYNDYVNIKFDFRDLKIRFTSDEVLKIHELNAREHEKTVVTFDCDVIAIEREKTYIKKADCFCPLCFGMVTIKCSYEREVALPICQNPSCRKQKMTLSKQNLVTDNIQFIYLQEMLKDVKNNTPIIKRGVLVGDLAGTIYVGQKKRITAIYKTWFSSGKDNIYDIVLEVLAANDLEEKRENCLTKDDLEMLKVESKKDGYVYKLARSFAPLIIGYDDIKLSILLYLVGGFSGTKRSDINILLVGDPSLAKSELLKECSRLSHKSMYTSGRGASAAGLTIGLVKMDNGSYVAQAGVMPLCDDGHACIDEFDKMKPEDRSSMHECMEQQTASIAKAGIRMTLPTRTSVLAAANPKYGRYDIAESLIDNIDVPVPLVSRFDMIWLLRDIVDMDEDEVKARHILDTFSGNKQDKSLFLTSDKLSSFLNYVRSAKPIITKEAQNELVRIYKQMRSLSKDDSLPIGVRQLEALARLCTAHAKLLFKDYVDVTDVSLVESLLKKMFLSLNIDLTKNFSQATLVLGKNETKEQIANRIWNECEDSAKTVNPTEFIKKLVASNKFTDSSAANIFARWDQECHIKLKGDGRYQKT